MRLLAILAAALTMFGLAAHAQDTVVIADAGMIDFVTQILMLVIAGIITTFLPILLTRLAARYGLQIEQEKRDALQTTLTNAAGGLLQRLGDEAKGMKLDLRNAALADAVRRAQAGAPDALKWAGLSQEEIARRILEKVAIVSTSNTAISKGV